ncbi:hypothetical protein EV363DRAFT_1177495 [Boletus edulis]|nr:hypothetical protein EV363DRAFT_1177495 [Boletus edulis]
MCERVDSPTLFINESGYVLAWYLPRAVSMVNQAGIWEALELLKIPLERSLARRGRSGTSWRTDDKLFREGATWKGSIDLSPGWFPQGHSVRTSAPLQMAKILQSGQPDSESIRKWLKEMAGINSIVSATMSIMHPDMHLHAREVMNRMWNEAGDQNDSDMSDILHLWPSVFNVLSVMVNRCSPLHLDRGGSPQFLDHLLTVGHYENVDMYMPSFKRILSYPPGSMLAFSGQRVIHGVPMTQKDRACFAWYMRERVHQGMNVQRTDFPHLDDHGM